MMTYLIRDSRGELVLKSIEAEWLPRVGEVIEYAGKRYNVTAVTHVVADRDYVGLRATCDVIVYVR